jgi:UDP-N-acetyl-D-glucosamine dehydrogenase
MEQTDPPRQKVVVVGQGYVGLPLAVRAVEAGHQVIGYDVDQTRVKRLAAGESITEDVTGDRLRAALASGRYRPSTDEATCRDFDIAVVTVPTPLRDGDPDLSYIDAAATTLGAFLRRGATVVLESTTYPGTTEERFGGILETVSGLSAGTDFRLGYSPERIDPANPSWSIDTTPKLVSGVDDASLEAVDAFYRSIVEKTVRVSSPKVAELAKLLENTYRHVNIALVNELAMFAGDLGIDVWDAIDAAASKPFGFQRFTPGPGVGGHCLPIDPSYLSWRVKRSLGHSFRFVELANDVNDHMPDYVVRRLIIGLNRRRKPVNGSRILILGLAYKPNIGDARESPSTRLIERLVALGADLRAADPHVAEAAVHPSVRRVEATADEVRAADVTVLVTDHDAFDLEMVSRCGQYVFDTRGKLPPSPSVERL